MDIQVADPLIGSLIDKRYRIRGRVAKGGMATVYTAVDERLERTVAVKIIHPGQVNDAGFVNRFTDEAKTVARLTHPNVVAVYDQGSHGGLPYLVMEYVRGRTLRDILAERRRLAPAEALAVLEQILSALGAAHRAGLVHRDVKPENVLVAEAPTGSNLVDAVVKVADFGLARAVEASVEDPDAGQLMATVAYVAPELVSAGYADPRSDVYSAGIMLYEMLTGAVPYDGPRPVDVAWQHVDRDVPPPSRFVATLPPSIDNLVRAATRRDPAARPTDAGALLVAVQAAREGLAGGNAATQQMQAVAADTTAIIPPEQRPAWARLPAPQQARPRPTRRTQETLVFQAREMYERVTNHPNGRKILAGALIGLLVLLLVGGWWLAFGRYEAAPQLIGQSNDQATALAQQAGLKVGFDGGVFSETVPKNTVMNQNPPPGQRIARGGTVMLTLSNGPERYLVPDVKGKLKDLAIADLQSPPFKLQVSAPESAAVYHDLIPEGMVVDTNPPVGAEVKPGQAITLILSKGRSPLSIPYVIGLQITEAESQLRGLGLKVIQEPGTDPTKPHGEVLAQTPANGTGAVKGDEVKLTVNNNPSMMAMPKVTGMGCQDGANMLRGMGFQVEIDNGGNPLAELMGKIKKQDPDPGKPAQPPMLVKLECR